MRNDVYKTITNRIIKSLEDGVVPWHKQWGGQEEHPQNLVSGKKYRGINTFMLSSAGYGSPYWLTYRQASERGGHVKYGEKGFPCIYWNGIEKQQNENDETPDKIPFLRYYTVFNVEQCENVQYPKSEQPVNNHSPIERCEQIVENMPNKPEIYHRGNSAYYNTLDDYVQIPMKQRFKTPEAYYGVLYHELCHSTGNESRLARPTIVNGTDFGSDSYSREELVAEMGAAYLCGHAGIENSVVDNSAAYINSWLERLNNDSRLVVTAGTQAQKAADYILGSSGGKYES